MISGIQGFLTDSSHISEFFAFFPHVTWRLLVFHPDSRTFFSIDVPSLIAVIDGVRQAATLDQSTADFLAHISRANMSRETLSGPNPDIGTKKRNRLPDPIPDTEDAVKPTGGVYEVFVLLEYPQCPRQFLAKSSFQSHLELHPGVLCTPIIRSFSQKDQPNRPWVWNPSCGHPLTYPLSPLIPRSL